MAYGNDTGVVVVDIVQKVSLLVMCTSDLGGSVDPQRALRSPKRQDDGSTASSASTTKADDKARSPNIDQVKDSIYTLLLTYFFVFFHFSYIFIALYTKVHMYIHTQTHTYPESSSSSSFFGPLVMTTLFLYAYTHFLLLRALSRPNVHFTRSSYTSPSPSDITVVGLLIILSAILCSRKYYNQIKSWFLKIYLNFEIVSMKN